MLASNLSSVLSLHLSSLHLSSVFASLGLCIIHPCTPLPLLMFWFNINLQLQHTSQIFAVSTASLFWDKSSPILSVGKKHQRNHILASESNAKITSQQDTETSQLSLYVNHFLSSVLSKLKVAVQWEQQLDDAEVFFNRPEAFSSILTSSQYFLSSASITEESE